MSSHGTVNGEQLQRAAWDKHGWWRGAREEEEDKGAGRLVVEGGRQVEMRGNQARCGVAQHGGGSTEQREAGSLVGGRR